MATSRVPALGTLPTELGARSIARLVGNADPLLRLGDLRSRLQPTRSVSGAKSHDGNTKPGEDASEARRACAALQRFQSAQDQLGSALSRLLVVVERYPELKATQNFRDLQAQREGTENRISVERMRFNEAAREFNATRQSFPTVLLAGLFGKSIPRKGLLHLGQEFWQTVVRVMEPYFARKDFSEGLVAGITAAGEALAMHYPYDATDRNELPDDVDI